MPMENNSYYFWARVDGKKVYVQTPIARTYIEEVKWVGRLSLYPLLSVP